MMSNDTTDSMVVFFALRPHVLDFPAAAAPDDLAGVFLAGERTGCSCLLALGLAEGGGGEAAVRRLGGM